MSTVTFNHTVLNKFTVNTGGGNYNKGGGAPGVEGQNAYSGSPRLALNTKVNSTTDREGVKWTDPGSTNVTLSANALILMIGTVADNPDLNATFGLEYAIGSAEGSHREYNVAGTGANNDWYLVYNGKGGVGPAMIVTAIDVNIAGWADSTVGTPTLTAIDFYAVGAQFIDGQAKSENVALDSLVVGTGITYTGTLFDFQDAVDADQEIITARHGWATSIGSSIFLRGWHVIEATGIDESDVTFPDGMHSTGLCGIEINSSDLELAGTYKSLGRFYGAPVNTNTKADLTVLGTSTNILLSGTFTNYRLITLTVDTTVTGTLEAVTINQVNATIENALIKTASSANNATLINPNLTNLTSTEFSAVGGGHGIRLTGVGPYTLDGLTGLNETGGYGADTTSGAAIHFTETTGTIVVNLVNGADTITYTSDGAIIDVQQAVLITARNHVISPNTRLIIEATDTVGAINSGDVLFNDLMGTDPFTIAHNYEGDLSFKWRARNFSGNPRYRPDSGTGVIRNTGAEISIVQNLHKEG